MARFFFTVVLLAFGANLAFADEPYLDNRSSAESLIRSLYNAVNLHDYARAFDYFLTPPSKDFDTYQKGYVDTDHVDVMVGDALSDGAAGSTYYTVPTAIRAKDKSGKLSYFAGCFTVRAVNGSIQDPPSRPWQIDKASLKSIKADDYQAYALPKCGDGAAVDQLSGDTVDAAKAKFVGGTKGICSKAVETLAGIGEPAVFHLTYRPKGSQKTDPDEKATLYMFECNMGAYNATEMLYIFDADQLQQVSFASPHLDLTYAAGDTESAKLKSMRVDGFVGQQEMINAEFDPKTMSLTTDEKWRGIGDARSVGTWVFTEGQFVLKDYEVDPTFDGEMNPITVFKDGKLKLVP